MAKSDQTVKQSSQQTTGAQQQTSQLTPWAGTGDLLGNLLGNLRGQPINLSGTESGALDLLSGMGAAGNPRAGAIGNVADTLLAGGGPDRTGIASDAYSTLQGQLTPTASGEFLDPNTNPFFADTTANISRDAEARIRNLYAGSGRDPTGAGSYAFNVGRGVGEATAPVYAGVYDAERARQLGAARDLFGAGGSTATLLSGLDQTRLGNTQAGIPAAGAALEAEQYGPLLQLSVEAQRRGIPLQALAQQLGLVMPAATAFGPQSVSGTTSGTATGTETSETKKDPLQQVIGGAIGGLGLLSGLGAFGPAAGLLGGGMGGLFKPGTVFGTAAGPWKNPDLG